MPKGKNSESAVEQNVLPIDSPNSLERILQRGKEVVTIWGGLIGSVVAILWVTGRTYARGYFEDAMGIPLYHIDLSIWEYVEVAWHLLLLWGIIFLVVGYGIFKIWQRMDKSKSLLKFGFVVILLGLVIGIWNTFSDGVGRLGTETGRAVVLRKGFEVEFTSDQPQSLGTPTVISVTVGSQIANQYIYSGFRLLTFNQGYYYVFQHIDPQTCRPKSVSVVDRKRLTQVQFARSVDLQPQCQLIK